MQIPPSYCLAGAFPPLDVGYLTAAPALNILLGLLCPWMWGISSQPVQHLPSYWGFSDLGCGVSLQGCSSKAQQPLLILDVGYLLWALNTCLMTMSFCAYFCLLGFLVVFKVLYHKASTRCHCYPACKSYIPHFLLPLPHLGLVSLDLEHKYVYF